MGDNLELSEPFVSISLRMPSPMWVKIDKLVEQKAGRDFSDTIRNMVEGGIWLYENKKILNDPEKMKKNIEDYNSKMNENKIFAWLGQLSDQQLKGLQMANQLEQEKRAKNHSN